MFKAELDRFSKLVTSKWATTYNPHVEAAEMSDVTQRWLELAERLTPEMQQGYLVQPLPSSLDTELTGIVRAFAESSPLERRRLQEHTGDQHSYLLIAYSERMASLAARERDPRRITDGLVALAMEGFDFDARDALLRFALLYHSATRLAVDPQALFDDAAALAPPAVAEAMRRFPRRKPEDRTLAAMGCRESRNPNSPLAYERTW